MGAQATALYTGRIYPGLRPFEAEDALLFFGREEQTDELLRRLEDTRFLAVVGLSGSGKSSLVRAGLMPALHRGQLAGAGSHWRVCLMRPGADPLGALARVLDEALGKRDDRLATLRSGSLGLVDASRHGRNADENILLVVDQFEEIFRFQDSNRPRASEAAEFVELILAATRDYEPAYRVYVVITLRSDYLGECSRFAGLPEALNDSQYLVPRMTREQLRDAIEGPAALGGMDLSADLLGELLARTSDDPDQLPVLQHLLMRMWEIRERAGARSRIGREQYEAVGGWDDALNRHAGAVWNALEDRWDLAKRMFQRLTEKAQGGREIRRPATVRELAAVAEVDAGAVKEVVEHFRQEGCNFLTSPDHELTDHSVIDISHESLIRRWKSLNEWATEEADWGDWYRRIEDRIRIGVRYVVDPELESALQAREKGRWNEAWAERYAGAKDGGKLRYREVFRFLDESKQRRSDELARLRRGRALVALAAILFAGLFAVATYLWLSARAARRQAETNAREALGRQLASDSARVLNLNLDRTVPALLGIESVRRAETVQGYEALWGASAGIAREVARLSHQDSVSSVAFSADGALVATGSWDKTARVFEAQTGLEVARLTHQGRVYAVAFSPESTLVATGSADKTARLFEARTGREVARLAHRDAVSAVAFSPDSTLVATGSADKTARVFEVRSGREVSRLAHQGRVFAVAFSPDSTLVATGSWDKTARVFEARTGREVARLAHGAGVSAVAFSPDGTLVATGSWDKTARVFDARTGHEVARLAHQGNVSAVSFSPDGTLVATGSADKTARVFEARTGREVAKLAHQGNVSAVAFSPDGTLVATGSLDNTARVFEARTGREVARLAHRDSVSAVAFSPDGTLVAAGSWDKTARVFEAHTGRQVTRLALLDFSPDGALAAMNSADNTVRVFEAHTGRQVARLAHQGTVAALAFSRDGGLVATGSDQCLGQCKDNFARVFETRTGREVSRLAHQGPVDTVAFSPDGTLVATGAIYGDAHVFEARTGRDVTQLGHQVPPPENWVVTVAFSPDGTLVVTGSADNTARVFETRTGREVARLPHQEILSAAGFSPEGALVATKSKDNTVRVFEARTGHEVARLAHRDRVSAVAFSPNGSLVATGSADKTARVFEARTGREVARLAHQDRVSAVAFSPDGTLVATGSWDKTARVFEARTGHEVARLAIGDPVSRVDFVSGGRLLRAVGDRSYLHITEDPIRASDLVADACSKLERNLTREEWSTYLSGLPYRETCQQLNPAASGRQK